MIEDFSHNNYHPKFKIKKDYEKKEFANPYFAVKKQPAPKFNTKLYLKIGGVLLLIYLLVYSDLFRIKNIDVAGAEMIDASEFKQVVEQRINSWRWGVLPQNNLIFLSKNWLAKGLGEKYDLASLKINKGWQSLQISLTEKISHLLIFNQKSFYLSDDKGAITKALSQEEAQKYLDKLPVLNVDNENINIGDNVVNEDIVKFILALDLAVKKTSLKINGYEKIKSTAGEREDSVAMVSKEGWRAYFDIHLDIKTAVDNLILVLNEKIKDRKNLQYIDLKLGDRVFYK